MQNLIEGHWYTFRIIRQVQMPDEGKYWLIQSPYGSRHMLDVGVYGHYGFERGKDIECRVDKVNCSGKVFLEPRHPVYDEGEIYSFEYSGVFEKENVLLEKERFLKVKDCFGNEIILEDYGFPSTEKIPSSIKLRVELLKKGLPVLREIMSGPERIVLREGQYLKFHIADVRNEEILLQGPDEKMYSISRRTYSHYRLKKGRDVICRVVKARSGKPFLLEPNHPFYRIGKLYWFSFERIENIRNSYGEKIQVWIVLDVNRREAMIRNPEGTAGKRVYCRVEMFKKGRLVLSLVPQE